MDPSEELLDIFDEEGNHIGIAPRSQAHAEGLWHQTAQVWVLNEKDELLLQLRAAQKSCFPDRWDISSAGHIPAGAAPLESAVRELEEELGVIKTEDQLQFLFKNVQPYIGANHVDREIAHVYLTKVKSNQQFILQESEVAEVRWIHYSDLLSDFFQNKDQYVNHELHFKKLVSFLESKLI